VAENVDPFGAAELEKTIEERGGKKVRVGPEPVFKPGFYEWWNSLDPIDASSFPFDLKFFITSLDL
jgi:hypothetical protein